MIGVSPETLAIRLAKEIYLRNKETVMAKDFKDDPENFKKETVYNICDSVDCLLGEGQLYYGLAENGEFVVTRAVKGRPMEFKVVYDQGEESYILKYTLPICLDAEFNEGCEFTVAKASGFAPVVLDQIDSIVEMINEY